MFAGHVDRAPTPDAERPSVVGGLPTPTGNGGDGVTVRIPQIWFVLGLMVLMQGGGTFFSAQSAASTSSAARGVEKVLSDLRDDVAGLRDDVASLSTQVKRLSERVTLLEAHEAPDAERNRR
jgi:uncharacterized protein YlxW (UPF0749 family)